MTAITELINDTITNLATQPSVFTACDVAAHADLTGYDAAIEYALHLQCANQRVLALDEERADALAARRYLGRVPVKLWWVESTLRWAKAQQGYMTEANLAREMALAFDTMKWGAVPATIAEVGRQWAMVADGYCPGIFTFPWAVVIHCNPRLVDGIRMIYAFEALDCDTIVEEVLHSLTERESDTIKRRNGMATGRVETLEQIGNSYGVSRERVRQIEQKAWRKLRHPARQQSLRCAFAADFVHTGGSLINAESEMTPHRKFLNQSIGLNSIHVRELGLSFMGNEIAITPYLNVLRDIDGYLESVLNPPCFPKIEGLRFLSQRDGERICNAEMEYRAGQVVKTRPRMLREALRSLGRAAHFEEIADVCNRMFPGNQASTRNWHAAMGRPDAEALGIVWIGTKGTYGLQEHDYSRPNSDLFEAVAEIVTAQFSATQCSVSEEAVMHEMGKQRRELNRNSVVMALAFNDRLEPVGRGEYIPRGMVHDIPYDDESPKYDIEAAFAAFSATKDSGNLRKSE